MRDRKSGAETLHELVKPIRVLLAIFDNLVGKKLHPRRLDVDGSQYELQPALKGDCCDEEGWKFTNSFNDF
jgi:hypothetical protein